MYICIYIYIYIYHEDYYHDHYQSLLSAAWPSGLAPSGPVALTNRAWRQGAISLSLSLSLSLFLSRTPPLRKPPREARGTRSCGPGPVSEDPGRGGGDGVTKGGTQCCATGDQTPGGTAGPLPGGDPNSDDEDSLPPPSDVPDFFVPFPRRGGRRPPPARVAGLRGSWSLIRQPAACESGAPNWTVVTLKRGPSLFLSLSIPTCICAYVYMYIYIYIYTCIEREI